MVDHPTILRNAPLQIVALELRFPETPFEPSDLKAIRRALADTYPDAATEHGIGIELSPEGVRQQQTNQRQVYRTIDGSHQIGLTQTTLALEARGPKYDGFRSLLERWITALDAVAPVADIHTQLRVGLRYINQLQVPDATNGLAALVGRITPALLGPLTGEAFALQVLTSMQELRLAGEYGRATLRHGLQIVPTQAIVG